MRRDWCEIQGAEIHCFYFYSSFLLQHSIVDALYHLFHKIAAHLSYQLKVLEFSVLYKLCFESGVE